MTAAQAPSLVVDTKGELCPGPIIKISQGIKQVKVGEVLEVLATDPGSKPDIAAWVRMTRNELISATELEGTPKVYRFQIRRLR